VLWSGLVHLEQSFQSLHPKHKKTRPAVLVQSGYRLSLVPRLDFQTLVGTKIMKDRVSHGVYVNLKDRVLLNFI
jgi:hypothetical protein